MTIYNSNMSSTFLNDDAFYQNFYREFYKNGSPLNKADKLSKDEISLIKAIDEHSIEKFNELSKRGETWLKRKIVRLDLTSWAFKSQVAPGISGSGNSFNIKKQIFDLATSDCLINAEGNTPLHLAVKAGHYSVIRELVQNSSYIKIKNNDGDSPLHLAAKNCDLEDKDLFDILNLLSGKDEGIMKHKNKYNLTAFEEAILNENHSVITWFDPEENSFNLIKDLKESIALKKQMAIVEAKAPVSLRRPAGAVETGPDISKLMKEQLKGALEVRNFLKKSTQQVVAEKTIMSKRAPAKKSIKESSSSSPLKMTKITHLKVQAKSNTVFEIMSTSNQIAHQSTVSKNPSEEILQRSEAQTRATSLISMNAIRLNNMGHEMIKNNRLQEGFRYLSEGLEIVKDPKFTMIDLKIKLVNNAARIYLSVSRAYFKKNNLPDARETLLAGLRIVKDPAFANINLKLLPKFLCCLIDLYSLSGNELMVNQTLLKLAEAYWKINNLPRGINTSNLAVLEESMINQLHSLSMQGDYFRSQQIIKFVERFASKFTILGRCQICYYQAYINLKTDKLGETFSNTEEAISILKLEKAKPIFDLNYLKNVQKWFSEHSTLQLLTIKKLLDKNSNDHLLVSKLLAGRLTSPLSIKIEELYLGVLELAVLGHREKDKDLAIQCLDSLTKFYITTSQTSKLKKLLDKPPESTFTLANKASWEKKLLEMNKIYQEQVSKLSEQQELLHRHKKKVYPASSSTSSSSSSLHRRKSI